MTLSCFSPVPMCSVNLRQDMWYLLSDTYPENREEEAPKDRALPRTPQKAVGVSGVRAAPVPGEGGERGRQPLEATAPRRSRPHTVQSPDLAAPLPEASHAPFCAQSCHRTPDRGEPTAPQVGDWSQSIPRSRGSVSRGKSEVPRRCALTCRGEAAVWATPAGRERGCWAASLRPSLFFPFSPFAASRSRSLS